MKYHREHLTSFMYENSKDFKIKNILHQNDFNIDIKELSITIDTIEDIIKANYLAKKITNKDNYHDYNEIIELFIEYNNIKKIRK